MLCSLRTDLGYTTRPWRTLYAYACCYLLPMSTSMRPTVRVEFNSPVMTTNRSRTSRCSASRRGGCLGSLPRISTSMRLPRSPTNGGGCFRLGQTRTLSWLNPRAGNFEDTAKLSLLGCGVRRGFAAAARTRGRRGVALGMGKGLERKKAKKSQARPEEKKGAAASPALAAPASAAMPEVSLEDIKDKEGFVEAVELYRKAKAPRKISQAFEMAKKKETDGLVEVAAAAVKAELKISREDLARSIIDSLGVGHWDAWLANDLEGAQAVIRCACAASEPVLAEELIVKAGFSCGGVNEPTGDHAKAAASVYPNLVTAFSRKGRRGDAMRLLEAIAQGRLQVETAAMNRLLESFHRRRDLEAVFKVLDAMAAGGVDGDDETYEWLANAAVRGVEFVTGAVSMETLPKEPVLPEAAFIGRSNVGKSSLINMVCNRKALAYTSKTPGKTQQFNYFLMNGNTEHAFYLVDMPGMGYAKVPQKQRKEWASLFQSYITRRSHLRVMFHLIDGRHGPVGQDSTIMKLMTELPGTARYVVVLTKADKSDNSVSKQVLESVVSALREAGLSRTPVVLTSATSKLGRDGVWRYLRLAALDSKAKRTHESVGKGDTAAGATMESTADDASSKNSLRRASRRRQRGLGSTEESRFVGASAEELR
ncbi:unnamed protein product [Ascophyllum nodosum]